MIDSNIELNSIRGALWVQILPKGKIMRTLSRWILSLGLPFFLASSLFAQETPDLNGLWFPDRSSSRGQVTNGTPFNAFAKGLYEQYVLDFGVADDPGGFCIKPGLIRSIWGAPFPVEITHNEGFITMMWEGYFQYRKIYMEGYDRPEPILHSGMGYSVGHWEDDVLVVETTYLREYPYMRRLPNTDEARVIEHIKVETGTDVNGVSTRYLTNDLTLIDPRLYTEPVTVSGTLAFSPNTPIMEYSCSDGLYDQYLTEKGLQAPDLNQ